jgi:hypothetical protein
MTAILNKFVVATCPFRPATRQEFFALRLAQRLNDLDHLSHYLALVSAHRSENLLAAYGRATKARGHQPLAEHFNSELAALIERRRHASQ